MQKILFISKGEKAPSTRYRATDFFGLFRQAGWQPTHITNKYSLKTYFDTLRAARKSDVVVIVRRTFGMLFCFLLRIAAKRLIYTFDDAVFLKSNGEHSLKRERRFARTVAACDHVWAGNSYLEIKARRYNANITVIPTALDPKRYDAQSDKPKSFIDIVWIGSSSTKKHLLTVLPALEEAAKSISRLRLKVVADFTVEARNIPVTAIRWSQDTEAKTLTSSHIGIAPLPDNAFTNGKCGLKVLQYMASKLPVISSPIGVNKDMVSNEINGLIATSTDEWVSAIKQLALNPDMRETMGVAGYKKCLGQFTNSIAFREMLSSIERY